ncbi:hypothetical protein CANCADRAFT_29229 [Tortispora caseinolytica NRRL Y-17796]|uniref:Major facilitator superfamily (MFS) profile domain-containing protein n=1 Tax=Tortispora caseinolytica NRRL Y-17796 TaxID=767744 RepID=A0A1E4TC15_9ASCO|nr:hypothetical protein CANCADRAFT_29229 [Tortispora caseinolytica NRRL Y-17796]
MSCASGTSRRPSGSTSSLKPGKVPRKDRRGLLANICIVEEAYDSKTYKDQVKALVTCIVAFAATTGPMCSSMFFPIIGDIASDLHTTRSLVSSSIGIFVLALGMFPIWWSSISEHQGRRTVYLISFFLFTCFCVGCALSTSIAMLIVFRTLAGACAASVQAVGAGTISDIYYTTQRGRAMGYFYLGPLCGPLLAPIISGALAARWDWRASHWFLVILGGIIFVCVLFCLPETLEREPDLAPTKSTFSATSIKADNVKRQLKSTSSNDSNNVEEEAISHHVSNSSIEDDGSGPNSEYILAHSLELYPVLPSLSRSGSVAGAPRTDTTISTANPEIVPHKDRRGLLANLSIIEEMSTAKLPKSLWNGFYKPLMNLRLLTYPPVFVASLFSCYCFAIVYLLNICVETVYSQPPYDFRVLIVGLMFIPNSVFYFMGSVLGGIWSDKIIAQSIKKHGKPIPESRIGINVMFASILLPAMLLVFGWCAAKHTMWVFPLIGTAGFGFGTAILFSNTLTYLVDALPGHGATGVAVNNFVRCIFAAIACFVAAPIYDAIGPGWLMTICAILGCGLIVLALVIQKYGAQWREKFDASKYF